MKKMVMFEISDADKSLFEKMLNDASSEAERKFFAVLKHKELYESAFANDLLVYEKENPDGVYLIRKYFDTFLVGYCTPDGNDEECENDTLTATLLMRLDQCVGFPEEITLLDWLRKYDFKVVRYDRNYDKD